MTDPLTNPTADPIAADAERAARRVLDTDPGWLGPDGDDWQEARDLAELTLLLVDELRHARQEAAEQREIAEWTMMEYYQLADMQGEVH